MKSELEKHIKSGENDLIREHLQNMFWDASKGHYIRKEDVPFAELEYLIESDNDKIRKWAYYVTCFYSNKKILTTLEENILQEKDELIRSWMFATAYKSNTLLYQKLKYKKDIGLSSKTISLIENLFQQSNNTDINKSFIKEVLENDSMVDKSWLTFNYKYKPDITMANLKYYKSVVPMDYISELTNLSKILDSDKNLFQVEEYALSALSHYSPRFSFSGCVKFKIDDIEKRDSDPRKWAYTLFWKDLKFVKKNIDFVKEIMSAERLKTKDREGLAKGLFDHYIYNKALERDIIEWHLREYDSLCKKYLIEYMRKYKSYSAEFSNQVEDKTTNIEKQQTSYTIIQVGIGNKAQIGNNNK
ncbi:hypothetical protein ACF3OE_01375 [Capnocytophaga canis]|uniref:hypothetical protein n=1 Tax=Capnocytophaga canis TaxID=1848903 RepID=UPI001ACFC9DA|nr:hypothetical protein [Capnocytophaga canis]GIM62183.1 hypothetical protein CAPN008_22330 [Capnocytophaga canis]